MWGSHGPYNNVYGSSGDGLCSSAGPNPDHQHFSAAAAAAAAAAGAAAGTAAVTGHCHAARAGSTGPAADTVPTGNTRAEVNSWAARGNFLFGFISNGRTEMSVCVSISQFSSLVAATVSLLYHCNLVLLRKSIYT